jgi:ADP-ribose pyrophosphatase YjhB (NUDIX family)
MLAEDRLKSRRRHLLQSQVERLRPMICFDTARGYFNYRTAAVILDDDHVLACREANSDIWFLPGGRCEMMETSYDAVRREVREEFGTDSCIERLLWIVENFFVLGERPFHEIGLYFLVTLPPDSPCLDKTRTVSFREAVGLDFEARWFPLAETVSINLVPWFLRKELSDLPAAPLHIIHNEIDR